MLQLTAADVALGKQAKTKQQAISQIAEDLVARGLVAQGYGEGMLERETQNSTYLGNGIAIPHGTTNSRGLVSQTGVQVHHFAEGVDWGDGNIAYLAIGIAAKSDEHLGILKQLTSILSADGIDEKFKQAKQVDEIIDLLNGEGQKGLLFDASLVELEFPTEDMLALVAVAASKLKKAQAIDASTVKSLIDLEPTHLGQGLWLVSSSKGVKQTALSFITPKQSFVIEEQEVRALLVVCAMNADYFELLVNLSNLLVNDKASALFTATNEEVVKGLTEVRQQGLTKVFTIRNPHGLHARPGATLVNVVKQFESKIVVSNLNGDGKQANAKSLMKVIALGVKQGHQLEFVADGSDAEQALNAIGEAIANGLGES